MDRKSPRRRRNVPHFPAPRQSSLTLNHIGGQAPRPGPQACGGSPDPPALTLRWPDSAVRSVALLIGPCALSRKRPCNHKTPKSTSRELHGTLGFTQKWACRVVLCCLDRLHGCGPE